MKTLIKIAFWIYGLFVAIIFALMVSACVMSIKHCINALNE